MNGYLSLNVDVVRKKKKKKIEEKKEIAASKSEQLGLNQFKLPQEFWPILVL